MEHQIEIRETLVSKFGTSPRQATERLLGLKGDLQESVLDLAMEIRKLVSLAHPSTPINERELLSICYLILGIDNKSLQRHLLSVDTTVAANTVLAIEE